MRTFSLITQITDTTRSLVSLATAWLLCHASDACELLQFNIADYQEKLYADILARRKEQRRQAKKLQDAGRTGRLNGSSRTASTASAGSGRDTSHYSRSSQR